MFFDKLTNVLHPPGGIDSVSIKKNIELVEKHFNLKFPKEYKHNIFPEKDGLFPLGRTDGGCLMWWHTAPKPGNWEIVVYDENSWEYERYDMQLCEFIYKYFTRQISCKGFPDSLRDEEEPCFVPNEFDYKKYCS